jgi:hypothetical protein
MTPRSRDDELDDDTAIVIDETIDTLRLLCTQHHDTNAAAELQAITTLIDHASSRLADAVADARDEGHTWADIARQLGRSRPVAIARYGPHAHRRRLPLELD